MRREVLDPVTDERWQSLVQASPDAHVFHHPAWLALVGNEYRYPMEAWVILQGNRIVGGLPVARVRSRLTGRRLVSVPFCDLCGPALAGDPPPQAREELLSLIAERQRREGIPLDIHDEISDLPGRPSSQRFLHHEVALSDDPGTVASGFTRSSLERGARKAIKLGLRVERRTDVAALDQFYRLHLETRRQQGVPIQGKRFIRRFRSLFEHGLGHVALVVDKNGTAVAAAVFLTFNGTLTYKYGASHREALGMRPNNLLFLDAIDWGCQHGMSRLDLGRTDVENSGLREFKLSLGAAERELSYTWLSQGPVKPRGTGVPATVRVLIRHGPPLVGRAIGKALYPHIA